MISPLLLTLFYAAIPSTLAVSNQGLLQLNHTQHCCKALSQALGSAVSYPLSPTYINEQTGNLSYWTLQESELTPACRVSPLNAQQVATAVRVGSQYHCKFAVRGGGHTTYAGAANIGSDGFTIDLSNMKSVKVSADISTVAVGAGARWIDVYPTLDALNISIAGGREAPVGVAGGKSFFSDKVGFVCDGLDSVELVTPTGAIITASSKTHSLLFKALKGGTNNFGIVTTFHFTTFPQGPLWGGFQFTPALTAPQQFTALTNYLAAPPNTTSGIEAIIAYVNVPGLGELFTNYFTNIIPTPTPPPALAEFVAIQPTLESTFRVANLSSLVTELSTGQSPGKRFVYGTFTVDSSGANVDYYNTSFSTFRSMLAPLFLNGSVTMTTMSWQKLSTEMLLHGCHGTSNPSGVPNSLGLCPSSPTAAPLVLVNFGITWSLAADDAEIYDLADEFVAEMDKLAKKKGIYNKYVYMNYALQSQDPLKSYGKGNLNEMRSVSRKFDPEGVFQRLVPGGFKLF